MASAGSGIGISVIIPAHDRRTVIGRAIESAARQSLKALEILVVDDGSTDGTPEVVEAIAVRLPVVRLIRLESRGGAAAARNAGIAAARGRLLAFLDSDDEWLEPHLERKSRRLLDAGAGLVFGSFVRREGQRFFVQRCPMMMHRPPLEYLFSGSGDFRTSTFVCDAGQAREVMFDARLKKHQDWDFLLNFHRRFPVTTDTEATAIAHMDGTDRMSARLDHAATETFFRKNRRHGTRNGWLLFASVMLAKARLSEDATVQSGRYLRMIGEIDPRARNPIRRLTGLVRLPGFGLQLYRVACRDYVKASGHLRRMGRGAARLVALALSPFWHRDYLRFIILSRSRTGSNLLASLLNSHPRIRTAGEIFARLLDEDPLERLDRAFGPEAPRVGARGFKIFYYHPLDREGSTLWDRLAAMRDVRVIHLTRRNVLRTLLSRKIAGNSDAWQALRPGPSDTDARQVEMTVDELETGFEQTRNWEQDAVHRFHAHPFLQISYEELAGDPRAAVRRVFEFLGLEDCEPSTRLRQQNPENLRRLIRNYDELKGAFAGSRWQGYFED